MKNLGKLALAILVAASFSSLFAQETSPHVAQTALSDTNSKPPEHFYHLVFKILEKDSAGKVVNSRSYSTMAATGNSRNFPIRTGSKIALRTNEHDIQYLDIGVNIDTQNVVEDGARLHLIVQIELSSVAAEQNNAPAPVIRQNKWGAEVVLPVGKPTVIFSSDNLEDKGQTEVELTATRVD